MLSSFFSSSLSLVIIVEVAKFQPDWLTAWANDLAVEKARDCNTDITVLSDSNTRTRGKCVRVAFMRVHLQAKHDDLLVWLLHICRVVFFTGPP